MITKSQHHKVGKIKNYFERTWSHNRQLARFDVTEDSGLIWVNVETTDNVYTAQGGHYSITPRGAITLWHVIDLCGNEAAKAERIKWYAEGVGGKVAK